MLFSSGLKLGVTFHGRRRYRVLLRRTIGFTVDYMGEKEGERESGTWRITEVSDRVTGLGEILTTKTQTSVNRTKLCAVRKHD